MSLISKEEIEKSKQDLLIVKDTCLQIQKDFQLFDEQIVHSQNSDNAYQELFDQIEPIIDRLLNLDSARFFSLLYAIDINQRVVEEVIFGQNKLDPAKELTHLIIERELLKVLTRKHFAK